MAIENLPPAPQRGAPVTVALEDLHDWLELRGLELVGFDADGRYFTTPKRERLEVESSGKDGE